MAGTALRGATGRTSALQQRHYDLLDDWTSLLAEVNEDGRLLAAPAKRLRESALRDGRFNDYQDATAILARSERMGRRK